MKIGIMGGTFDPIHIGHLLLGEFAYEDFGLNEIWFLPNGSPPHKPTDDTDTALNHRIEMIRKAIAGVPYFRLNLFEADTEHHSYTYQTLGEFNRIYPEHEFYFILGADSLFSIEQWRDFQKIFPTCVILAAMRDDKDADEMRRQIKYLTCTYGAKICLLQAPLLEISSTVIRDRAARNLGVRYMVPDSVAEYIKSHHLYQKTEERGADAV